MVVFNNDSGVIKLKYSPFSRRTPSRSGRIVHAIRAFFILSAGAPVSEGADIFVLLEKLLQ